MASASWNQHCCGTGNSFPHQSLHSCMPVWGTDAGLPHVYNRSMLHAWPKQFHSSIVGKIFFLDILFTGELSTFSFIAMWKMYLIHSDTFSTFPPLLF